MAIELLPTITLLVLFLTNVKGKAKLNTVGMDTNPKLIEERKIEDTGVKTRYLVVYFF